MRKFLSFLSFAVLAFGCISCYHEDKTDLREKAMVAILKEGQVDYWQQIGYSFSQECEANGLTPLIYYTDNEIQPEQQVSIVSGLDAGRYSIQGIAFAPIWNAGDHSAEQAVADFASKHKIPVTIVDSPIDAATSPLRKTYVSYVGTDNTTAAADVARNISAPASSILVVGAEGSVPVSYRTAGITSVKGEAELWITTEAGVKDIASHIKPSTTDIIFLNGHLFRDVMNEVGIYNVYTFDIYNETIPLLYEDSFLKGVVAQDTYEMGRQAVVDLLKAPKDKQHNIPVIYLDSKNISTPAVSSLPLMKYMDEHSPY